MCCPELLPQDFTSYFERLAKLQQEGEREQRIHSASAKQAVPPGGLGMGVEWCGVVCCQVVGSGDGVVWCGVVPCGGEWGQLFTLTSN